MARLFIIQGHARAPTQKDTQNHPHQKRDKNYTHKGMYAQQQTMTVNYVLNSVPTLFPPSSIPSPLLHFLLGGQTHTCNVFWISHWHLFFISNHVVYRRNFQVTASYHNNKQILHVSYACTNFPFPSPNFKKLPLKKLHNIRIIINSIILKLPNQEVEMKE